MPELDQEAGARGIEIAAEDKVQEIMSERIETFKFNLKCKVLIREIQRPGSIMAMMIDFEGVSYRVAYWDNSERKFVWLPEEEIDLR